MSKLLQLRMNEKDFKELKEKAEKLGLTVSAYVRMLIKTAKIQEGINDYNHFTNNADIIYFISTREIYFYFTRYFYVGISRDHSSINRAIQREV